MTLPVSGSLLVLLIPLVWLRKPDLLADCCCGLVGALPQLINVWRGEMSLLGLRPLTLGVMQALQARFPGAELR